MRTCPNCGEAVADTAKFCGNCAAPVQAAQPAAEESAAPEATAAPVAEVQPEASAVTAPAAVETPADEPVAAPVPPVASAPAAAPKKGLNKGLLIGGIGVLGVGAVAAAIGLAVTLFSSKNDNIYYYKDGELVAATTDKEPKHWELTGRLCDESLSSYEISSLSYMMLLSDDGKKLFYPDRLDDETGLYTLYYRDANDSEAEPVKVDSEISFYAVNKKATTIYYIKGDEDDATLYRKSLKDDSKTKIADGVEPYFCANADLSRILYFVSEEVERTEDDYVYTDVVKDIFEIVDGGEPARVDRGVDSLEYISKDMSELYYIKEDSLYYKKGSEEKVKIASDVYNVVKVYDSGTVYFVRENESDVTLSTYVDDDLKASDEALEEPVYPTRPDYPDYPEYPSWYDYDTDEEYDAAYDRYLLDYAEYEAECDRLDDVYDKACDAYWEADAKYDEKLYRDRIRENLEEFTLDVSGYTLCYYNGSEIETVHDSVRSSYYFDDEVAANSAKILFRGYEAKDVKKVKMSEMGDSFSIYDLEAQVREALFGSTVSYIANGASAAELSVDFGEHDTGDLYFNEKGDYVYYFLDSAENSIEADLYRAPVTENGLGTEEQYDTEVYFGQLSFEGGHVVYFKDVPETDDGYSDGSYGDLYIDKQLVDYDVSRYDLLYNEEEKVWYYLADYDDDDECGELKVYNGKESKSIAADVVSFDVDPSDRLFYINDYSSTYDCGTLYYFDGKKSFKIDEDVTAVLPVVQGGNVMEVLLDELY